MSEERRRRVRHEKDEKQEKEEEKQEKSWEEKWRRDPIGTLTWALIFIWGGVVLILETQNVMVDYPWWSAWAFFFAGAGVLLLLQALYRLASPAHRRGVTGALIFGFIFGGIGLGGLVGWEWVWPLVLFAIAAIILVTGFVVRRR